MKTFIINVGYSKTVYNKMSDIAEIVYNEMLNIVNL